MKVTNIDKIDNLDAAKALIARLDLLSDLLSVHIDAISAVNSAKERALVSLFVAVFAPTQPEVVILRVCAAMVSVVAALTMIPYALDASATKRSIEVLEGSRRVSSGQLREILSSCLSTLVATMPWQRHLAIASVVFCICGPLSVAFAFARPLLSSF